MPARTPQKAPRVSPSRTQPSDVPTDAQVRRALQAMPNIGPRMADDLVRLGIRRIEDLARRDPVEMYDAISALDGVRHDPCVLDTYMAAVDHARTGSTHPWWKYTPRRKALLKELAREESKSSPASGKKRSPGAKRQ